MKASARRWLVSLAIVDSEGDFKIQMFSITVSIFPKFPRAYKWFLSFLMLSTRNVGC